MLTSTTRPRSRIDAVVLGASAGAIDALGLLLPPLPAGLPVPVVIVVHIPARSPSLLVELFSNKCALSVGEPTDKLPVGAGIWFAPPDYHLLIESDRTFSLSVDEPVHYSRPSIDVLFESAARAYGPSLLGVVLTGASFDGQAGAIAIVEHGGVVVVQDPKTAESPVLPASVIASASPDFVGSLAEISVFLRETLQGASPA